MSLVKLKTYTLEVSCKNKDVNTTDYYDKFV